MPEPLRLRTGLLDDRRAPIAPDDRYYGAALDLFEQQATMSLDEHGLAWTYALVWWRRPRGHPSITEAQSRAAARLADDDCALDRISAVLGLAPDTLRHRSDRTERRDRASIERGRELAGFSEDDLLGGLMRWRLGTLDENRPPLPRIYQGEREPEVTYFNPRIRLLDGAWAPQADAPTFLYRAARELSTRHRERVGAERTA